MIDARLNAETDKNAPVGPCDGQNPKTTLSNRPESRFISATRHLLRYSLATFQIAFGLPVTSTVLLISTACAAKALLKIIAPKRRERLVHLSSKL